MLNQSILVGRIKSIESNNEDGIVNVTILTPKPFKNNDGEYEVDTISCTLYTGVANATVGYCKVGDMIGIKGRLQTKDNLLQLVAEKVSFLNKSNCNL